MNYQKHYDLLITRAQNRNIRGYTEKHHIIPRCMGGSDDKINLVRLTPEEHYVAHQLLVKIHPNHQGLINAAVLMTACNIIQVRNNKLFGWIKRKLSVMKSHQMIGRRSAKKGIPVSDYTKRKISESKTGSRLSMQTREKLSIAKIGKPPSNHIIVSCPHCDKSGSLRIMKRWHFNNCKHL